jgi:tetratricopeptide (TPR) repeat protein
MSTHSLECFVIMPIRREGTEEFAHFKALYEYTIKPTLEGVGYHVVRADEVTKAGAITKDVVERLARADLVVADMTDLNPNVFWELGVRHALNGRGTLTLIDEKRTSDIPFDLTPYRVIKYAGELLGLGRLKERLTAFAAALKVDAGELDSPVHDWLPILPTRALDATENSDDGALRQQLADLRRQLKQYERIYGEHDGVETTADIRPLDVIAQAMEDAASGSDDAGIRRRAAGTVENEDVPEFLAITRQVLQHDANYYAPELFSYMVHCATRLALSRVAEAILDHAHAGHPHASEITENWLATLAHSHDSAQRERARREFERVIGITVDSEGNVNAPEVVSDASTEQLGFMLDACHRDGLHARALRITTALIAKAPDDVKILRNHARALGIEGRIDESFTFYQRAVSSPKVDESSFLWYGSALHNRGRYVDAVESYLLACLKDPNDANYFAHVADDISWALVNETEMRSEILRRLPNGISAATVIDAIVAALSCTLSPAVTRRLESVARRVDADLASIAHKVKNGNTSVNDGRTAVPMERRERIELIRRLYEVFRSSLTEASH